MGIKKIISGGQTGVDRAALDAARLLGIDCGGWCPRKRTAEDGPIPGCYPLTEAEPAHGQGTKLNIRDADGTLIVSGCKTLPESDATLGMVRRLSRPNVMVSLKDGPGSIDSVRRWIRDNSIEVLHVAGPSESSCQGIYTDALDFFLGILGESEPVGPEGPVEAGAGQGGQKAV